jgi:DNA polymerase zeta
MQSFKQGAVVVNDGRGGKAHLRDSRVETVVDELDILNRLMDLLRDFDPDVLAGWEVQNTSWGYIRARCQSYGMRVH